MSAPRGSEGLDVRRRRILFRAWHRGTREMDLTMGRFADSELRALPDADLDDLEALMEVPDRDVFSWLTGELETPGNYDTAVFRKVRAFPHPPGSAPSVMAATVHRFREDATTELLPSRFKDPSIAPFPDRAP